MLVIKRKANESLKVGDSIEIHILAVGKNYTKIGVTAPRDVAVLRSELVPADTNKNRPQSAAGDAVVFNTIEYLI
jgi:carbon storage regulator